MIHPSSRINVHQRFKDIIDAEVSVLVNGKAVEAKLSKRGGTLTVVIEATPKSKVVTWVLLLIIDNMYADDAARKQHSAIYLFLRSGIGFINHNKRYCPGYCYANSQLRSYWAIHFLETAY